MQKKFKKKSKWVLILIFALFHSFTLSLECQSKDQTEPDKQHLSEEQSSPSKSSEKKRRVGKFCREKLGKLREELRRIQEDIRHEVPRWRENLETERNIARERREREFAQRKKNREIHCERLKREEEKKEKRREQRRAESKKKQLEKRK